MSEIATKDQEREALAKIKKIVEALGPQSYLATAFEGCFQDAEDNIENDFAFSMASRYQSEHEKAVHNEGIATEACKAVNAEKGKNAELQKQIDTIEESLEQTRASAETLNHLLTEQREATCKIQRREEEAEQTIIKLKARLYDYMINAAGTGQKGGAA